MRTAARSVPRVELTDARREVRQPYSVAFTRALGDRTVKHYLDPRRIKPGAQNLGSVRVFTGWPADGGLRRSLTQSFPTPPQCQIDSLQRDVVDF